MSRGKSEEGRPRDTYHRKIARAGGREDGIIYSVIISKPIVTGKGVQDLVSWIPSK